MIDKDRKWTRAGLGALMAAALLALAACGGNDEPAPAEEPAAADQENGVTDDDADLVVVLDEFEFVPADLEIEGTTTITVVNEGLVEHDFTVEGTDIHLFVEPGESATGTIDLDPGTYDVFCAVAGHREAGMETTLTVK